MLLLTFKQICICPESGIEKVECRSFKLLIYDRSVWVSGKEWKEVNLLWTWSLVGFWHINYCDLKYRSCRWFAFDHPVGRSLEKKSHLSIQILDYGTFYDNRKSKEKQKLRWWKIIQKEEIGKGRVKNNRQWWVRWGSRSWSRFRCIPETIIS